MAQPSEPNDLHRDLEQLAAELRRLETEYNMFFAGRLPRPPWETRARVETIVKRCDRRHIDSLADRFRFSTLQARYATFADLWDRGLRAREEGRPGPFAWRTPDAPPQKLAAPEDRVIHVAAFADPRRELDKLRDLYDALMDARREAGEGIVPFHRFADLVRTQVTRLQEKGSPEVAFRVAVKAGQVKLTVRALKGLSGERSE